MPSAEAVGTPSFLELPERRRSNSYDTADSGVESRKLSFRAALLISRPGTPAASWEGDGSSTPKPNRVDGYFSNVLISTPSLFSLNRSTHDLSSAPHSPFGVDPPRPAREGFEWVWFPEGYWAEREIALSTPRKSAATGFLFKWRTKSGKSFSEPGTRRAEHSSGRDASPKSPSPRTLTPSSPYASEEAHVASLQQPFNRHLIVSSDTLSPSSLRQSCTPPGDAGQNTSQTSSGSSTEGETRPSVLCIPGRKDRRRLKKSRWKSKQSTGPNSTEEVTMIADAVGRTQRTSTSRSFARYKEECGNPSLVKKWFGKAPWHRKESGESASSVTSSVREILAGKTPPVTPASETTFSSQIFASNYPGGEARRITTPPLNDRSVTGRTRAFFSETRPPGESSDTWIVVTPASDGTSKKALSGHRKSLSKQQKEWWDQMPRTLSRRDHSAMCTNNFEFDIPEHLPNSPMCPANVKHRSGGTGVCVYHGRLKSPLLAEKNERREGSEVSITDPGDEQIESHERGGPRWVEVRKAHRIEDVY